MMSINYLTKTRVFIDIYIYMSSKEINDNKRSLTSNFKRYINNLNRGGRGEFYGGNQILITPHIAGMTVEGQYIAYNHAVKMLRNYLKGK